MRRIVARNGMVTIDDAGSAPGRGGYLHPEPRCLEKFAASKVREFRSLKSSIDRDQRLRIIDAVKGATSLDSEARLK
jgi:predicted RNA-binding protein YlxR (DUF448 family)